MAYNNSIMLLDSSIHRFLAVYRNKSAFEQRKARYGLFCIGLFVVMLLVHIIVRLTLGAEFPGLLRHVLLHVAMIVLGMVLLYRGQLQRSVDLIILMLVAQCSVLLPKEVSREFYLTIALSMCLVAVVYIKPYQRWTGVLVFPLLAVAKSVLEFVLSARGLLARDTTEQSIMALILLMAFISLMRGLTGIIEREILYAETLKDVNRSLYSQLDTDELTGLLNRRAWDQVIPRELERCRREGKQFLVCFFDVDHFKAINDTRGHEVGDRVLVELGRSVAQVVRASDYFFRWGGDEFALVCIAASADSEHPLIAKIKRRINANLWLHGMGVSISGGYTWSRSDDNPEVLLARADANLYRAKAAGRNRMLADDEA